VGWSQRNHLPENDFEKLGARVIREML